MDFFGLAVSAAGNQLFIRKLALVDLLKNYVFVAAEQGHGSRIFLEQGDHQLRMGPAWRTAPKEAAKAEGQADIFLRIGRSHQDLVKTFCG